MVRVYGMYIGAEVEYGVMLGDREIYDRGTLIGVTLDEEGEIQLHVKNGNGFINHCNEEDKLLLKPLSEISDADINEAWEFVGMDLYINDFGKDYFLRTFNPFKASEMDNRFGQGVYLLMYDFLRSRGYALPYKGQCLFQSGIAINSSENKEDNA